MVPSRRLRDGQLREVGVGGHHFDLAHLLAEALQVGFDLLNAMLREVTRPLFSDFSSLHGRRFERRLSSILLLLMLRRMSVVFLSLRFLGSALLNYRATFVRLVQRHVRIDDNDVLITPIV